ncbi:MAG: class I SAM-dependent methyltransferase [Burkholderiaceae bacterium]|nr:class I SAM-dependent methyltransferase [Burkholderiaceae bacterium]
MERPDRPNTDLVDNELDLLHTLVPLQAQAIVELGCGKAELARQLLARWPGCTIDALEVDEVQLARNRAAPPVGGLRFVHAGAQQIPFADQSFDLALMLKSLHHVPLALMAQALAEARRVLRPGSLLYVSEPVFAGPFNEVMRLFHDEETVRGAAYAALQAALAGGGWTAVAERHFDMPVRFADFDDFRRRMIEVSFNDHRLSDATLAAVRSRFETHLGANGARFHRPMRVNLLRRA